MITNFFNQFSEWPLDGLIGFFGLILGIVLLLFGARIPPQLVQKNEEGYYFLRTALGQKILSAGMTILASIFIYGMLQAGDCFNMTDNENMRNKIAAILISGAVTIGTMMLLYHTYFFSYAFNEKHLIVKPFWQSQKYYEWKDFLGFGHKRWTDTPFMDFGADGQASLPSSCNGAEQLEAFVAYLTVPLDRDPIAPIYDSDFASLLEGKPILLSITFVDRDYIPQPYGMYYGHVKDINTDFMVIGFEDFEDINIPANFRFISESHGGMYGDDTEDKPVDFMIETYISDKNFVNLPENHFEGNFVYDS